MSILTDHPEEFAIIINVRGVESSFQESWSFVTVKRDVSALDEFF